MNEPAGWLGIFLGILSGAWLGLHYDRADWFGGYGSLRRRLLRLGHIALIALGFLNILFAGSAHRLNPDDTPHLTASWCLLIGAFAMPGCCFLNAWRPRFKPLFTLPVVLLATGTFIIFRELVSQ